LRWLQTPAAIVFESDIPVDQDRHTPRNVQETLWLLHITNIYK
jgi:hypothetical protein